MEPLRALEHLLQKLPRNSTPSERLADIDFADKHPSVFFFPVVAAKAAGGIAFAVDCQQIAVALPHLFGQSRFALKVFDHVVNLVWLEDALIVLMPDLIGQLRHRLDLLRGLYLDQLDCHFDSLPFHWLLCAGAFSAAVCGRQSLPFPKLLAPGCDS